MSSALGREMMAAGNGNDGVLPTDMLYEVLLCVPAKELCRLRLVCRSWRSLTYDRGFAKAHASRHPLVAGIRNSTELHLLDLSGNIVRRVLLRVPQRRDVYDLSTQLDLACVSAEAGCLSYVVNPVTGEVLTALSLGGFLQDFRHGLIPHGASFIGSSPAVLGHVPSTGEYKLLRTTSYSVSTGHDDGALFGDQERIVHTCDVLTLGRAWRARPCRPVECRSSFRDRVVIHGVAYFFLSGTEPDAIASFDLATEKWRPNILRGPFSSQQHLATADSKGPNFSPCYGDDTLQLLALNGSLVIAHHKNRGCSMDLWFLVDMDTDKGIWTKRYSIHCVPCCDAHASMPPCPLHILDDGRVLTWGGEKDRVLRVYDPRTNMCANLTSMEHYGYMRMHLGTLLRSGVYIS